MSAHADASQSVVDPVPQRRVTSNVTCLACGCLCDDLQVTVEKGSLREAKNACEVGRTWFEWGLSLEPVPTAAVGGRTATLEEALGRATELIANSRAPVVYGLSSSMTETVRDALELAEGLGARVVLSRTAADLGRVAAFQRAGRVSATLGEVKNRADVVVFWGSDPSRTHPRHAERYSIEPSGRFVPLGRAGRSIVVVDAEQTATAGVADLFLPIPPALDVAALVTLRMMIGTRSGGEAGVGTVPSLDVERLAGLATLLRGARYGAFFFQSRTAAGDRSGSDWEAASRLVRELNDVTRFVLLALGGPGNLTGAEAAMTWQAGYPQGVDYRLGLPTPLDDLATLEDILDARETDLVLALGDAPIPDAPGEASGQPDVVPFILVGPRATARGSSVSSVAIATAMPAIDEGGTVVRADGVNLPVRPVRQTSRPTERAVIQELIRRVSEAAGRSS